MTRFVTQATAMTLTTMLPNRKSKARRMRRGQRGYALLMIMFFIALLVIAGMAAGPRILTEGKREKEKEMVWRGKQYVRGVRMYYRKLGRFPTSLDDLTKPKVGNLRFMRKAYKDPMNSEDGSWRLIYVGPSGQLIGSLKPPQTLQVPGAGPGLGASASSVATNSAQQQGQNGIGGQSSFASSFGTSAFNNSGVGGAQGNNAQGFNQQGGQQGGQQAAGQNGAQPGQPGAAGDGSQAAGTNASGAASDSSGPQPITPSESSPQIIGGNIIGVGSKKIAPSLLVYDKAKNYHLFEFIWDPSKDVTIAGAPPSGTGFGAIPGTGGNQSGFGLSPSGSGSSFGGSSFGQSSFGQPGQNQNNGQQNNQNNPNNQNNSNPNNQNNPNNPNNAPSGNPPTEAPPPPSQR